MKRRFAPLNWIQWLSLVTVVAFALLLPFIIVRVDNAHRDTNNTIRTLLCYFEQQTLASPRYTPAEKHQTVVIYGQALARIQESDCTPK